MNAHDSNTSRSKAIWRILDWIDYILVGTLVVAVLLICGITWWLTPERLSEIVDREASERLNADVKTGDISFTFWSTFPHFCIVADSLHITSHNLDSIPQDVREKLPANPDFLVSTGRFEGGINIAKLLRGQIWLRNVAVKSLKLNLVAVNDSLNNYNLVPSTGKSEIPYFNIDKLRFIDGGEVNYFSLLSNADARISLKEASLMPRKGKNNYHLMFKGDLYATASGFALLRNFPFELDGDVQFKFKPFGITTNNYTVNFGQVKGELGMDLDIGGKMCLNNFDYSLRDFTLDDLRMFLPDADRELLKRFDADLQLQASARLTSPYDFSSGLFPSVEVDFLVPSGSVGYTFNDNVRYAMNDVGLAGRFIFNGEAPETSYLEVNNLHLNGLGAEIKATARVTNITTEPRIEIDMQGRGDLAEAGRRVKALQPLGLAGGADFKVSTSFNLNGSDIIGTKFNADVNSDNLAICAGGYDFSLSGLHVTTSEKYSDALSMKSNVSNLPVNLNINVDKANVNDSRNRRTYAASGIKANAFLNHANSSSRSIALNLTGSSLNVTNGSGASTIDITGLKADANLTEGKSDNVVNLSGQKVRFTDKASGLICDVAGLNGKATLNEGLEGNLLKGGAITLQGDNLRISDQRHEAEYFVTAVKAQASLSNDAKKNVARLIDLKLSGAKVEMNTPGLQANLNDVSLGFNASYLDKPVTVPDYTAPAAWYKDNESMDRISHSEEFVRVNLPVDVRNLMARWKVALNLKTSGGDVDIDNYLLNLKDVDLAASLDSLVIHNASVAHGDTRGDIAAKVTNLRQFLTSKTPAPLYLNANVSLDTVQINQLARDFTKSHPNSAVSRGDDAEMGAGIDTVAIILPRNIYADVHATAMQTRYTNLHLYNLMTDVHMGDGKASVDTLHISSDFGQLSANVSYDTSDLQNINVGAGFRFYDVNVVGFFQNFQKLEAMWPQMKNLSGTLSIGMDARAHVFPNMFVNAPSLWANAFIDGKGLQLHQNDFIRHLAHMLLIFQEGPINIEDVKFHAVVHSNLLEIFPTTFEVSKYKLVMMGLNNFNGNLYYHVGVENWPLKIPFGVNIKGDYHHPEMRFGGKDWHDKNGAMITGGVQDTNSFNLVHKVRHYSGEFIHSAASYDE